MILIVEIGQNHNGDMKLAKEMIYLAKENGADIVKFQVYDVNKVFTRENNPWYEYNCKTELSKEDLHILYEECLKCNVEFMASVFDTERVGWLEELEVKHYKIASRSIYDSPLIEALSATGKPLIVSLGQWNSPDFPLIDTKARVDFLYCISKYPAPLAELKLSKIDFSKYSGFSDHTEGLSASMAALARGAKIIEKHFTVDKNMYGPDHSCSMTPGELLLLHKFRLDLEECL